MTKTQTATLVTVAVLFAVPAGLQQAAIRRSQAQIIDVIPNSPVVSSAATETGDLPAGESELEEMARLRAQIDELRARLSAKAEAAPQEAATPRAEIGPVLLAGGRRVRVDDLVYVGNSTPEAALQSVLALQRDGDLDALTGLMLIPPDQIDRWYEMLGNAEEREEIANRLSAIARGAVIESVAVRDDGDATVLYEGTKELGSEDDASTVQVIQRSDLDQRRVQLRIQYGRGSASREDSMVFGLTQNGWKAIP